LWNKNLKESYLTNITYSQVTPGTPLRSGRDHWYGSTLRN